MDGHASAVEWAEQVRQGRDQLREELRSGQRGLGEVLSADRFDPLRRFARLQWVLESRPGIRKIDSRRQLAGLGIDPCTELHELNPEDVTTLIHEFEEAR